MLRTHLAEIACQLLHEAWQETISYSRQGAWRCRKPNCASQMEHDRQSMLRMLGLRRPSTAAHWTLRRTT